MWEHREKHDEENTPNVWIQKEEECMNSGKEEEQKPLNIDFISQQQSNKLLLLFIFQFNTKLCDKNMRSDNLNQLQSYLSIIKSIQNIVIFN